MTQATGCRLFFRAVRACVLGALMALAGGGVDATLVHDFYLPLPESQVRASLLSLQSGTGTTLDSVFSIVITGVGTQIHYDHWEDGYETDLDNPSQVSTEIWGDGNDANGKPPGYATDPLSFSAGSVISLRNLVPLPRNPAVLLFDGRDRLAATKAIVVSRAAWATTPGTVLAGAVEVGATIDYGTRFVSPVGQDVGASAMFEYVALFVMAGEDGTVVTLDPDGGGATAPFSVTLNRGESYHVNGGIRKGATVLATKPVQAHIITGDIGANYESRWYTLYPVEQWSSRYFTPVGTANDGDTTFVFLYNTNATALTIDYSTMIGSGSLSVGAGDAYAYQVPRNSGARFESPGGEPFFALAAVGANPSANNVHDWGFSLLPFDSLTTEAVVGWGPGSGDLSQNGSPVWVTATAATRVYVDFNGDRSGPLTDPQGSRYDAHYDLGYLQSQTVYDPDKDQTAMRLYTLDGATLAVAWGQDPAVAGAGNPYLDLGTTVLPFPTPVLTKTSRLLYDRGAPGLSTNDVIEYTITIENKGLLPLGNTLIVDELPAVLLYSNQTTRLNGTLIPDHLDASPFPLGPPQGYTIPIILRGGTSEFTFEATVMGYGSIVNSGFSGQLSVSNELVIPPPEGAHTNSIRFTDAATNDVALYSAGDGVYLQLTDPGMNLATTAVDTVTVYVYDDDTGDVEPVLLTETGPDTGVFFSNSPLPTSLTAGLGSLDGTLNVAAGDSLSVTFTDPGFGDTCSDTAVIVAPSLTKLLYLTTDGADDDLTGSLDRIDPAALGDLTVSRTLLLTPAGAGSISVVGAAASSSSGATVSSHSFSYDSGSSGANRILMVGISYRNEDSETVTGVTYNGQAMTLVGTAQRAAGTPDGRIYIYRLLNPPTGANTLQVTWNSTLDRAAVVGAVTYAGVDQTTPTGTFASANNSSSTPAVTVAADTGRLVFGVVSGRTDSNYTVTGGGTLLWSARPVSGQTSGSGQSKEGASPSVELSWSGTSDEWVAGGVSLIPAPVATIPATFTQTPAMCGPLVLPAGASVSVRNYMEAVDGPLSSGPSLAAVLRRNGTVFAALSSPTATLLSGGFSTVTPEVTTSSSSVNTTSLSFPHTAGSGTNRLLLVTLAVGATTSTGNPPTVTGVTYGGSALVLIGSRVSGTGSSTDDAISYIYAVTNPAAGPANVVVSLSGSGSIAAGATTFTGVDQANPLGTLAAASATSGASSVLVSSAAGEVVVGTVARDEGPTLSIPVDQTSLWLVNDINGVLSGAASHEPGAASVTHSYSSGSTDQDWAMLAVPVKPAWSPAIYRVDWSAALASTTTVAVGEAVSLDVTNMEATAVHILYDSSNYPSRVSLPVASAIAITNLAAYDAPYPGGYPVGSAAVGTSLYVRVSVSDPFGAYDITSLDLSIAGPDTNDDVSVTLTDADAAASNACSKTYEYLWVATSTQGLYTIAATAHEGSEGITAEASTSVTLTFLDLGTPSTTEFTTGDNGPHTLTYETNETVYVRVIDVDQNLDSGSNDTIQVTIVSPTGDSETITLTETGPNTGIFTGGVTADASGGGGSDNGTLNAPAGSLLTVTYVDPDDPTDTGFDTATIPLPAGVAAINVNKTLTAPADSQALVGETVQFSIQVANIGSVTLTNVVFSDTFPTDHLAYVSASFAPDTVSGGTLTWNNIGPLASGQVKSYTLFFTAIASAAPATNSAAADADGGTATDSDEDVVSITQPAQSVVKTLLSPSVGPVGYGSNVVFRIAVSNAGDTAIETLPLEDMYSGAFFEFVSATPAPDAVGSGSLLWFDLTGAGSLSVGATTNVDVTLRVKGAGNPAVNTAMADYSVDEYGDPVPPASSSTSLVTVAASLSGRVYEDLGGGVTGVLANVSVALYTDPDGDGDPADGTLVGLTSTALDGGYEFLNLATGRYVIVETDLLGYRSVSDTQGANDNRIALDVAGSVLYAGNDFVDELVPLDAYGSITGQVREDSDADGNLADVEPGIGGVTIELYTDPNGDGNPADGVVLLTTTTSTNGMVGAYVFTNVPPGTYVVVETDPAGYASTADAVSPNDNRVPVTVVDAMTSAGNDFLDVYVSGAIGDRVWLDENGDGVQDAGEAGIPNVVVILYDGSGIPLATTRTDAAGGYLFAAVPGGTYRVAVATNSLPAGLAGNQTGDPDASFNHETVVTVARSAVVMTADFGYNWAPAVDTDNSSGSGAIGDHVWIDANGDGIQDPGEAGLSNITVRLYVDIALNGAYTSLVATAVTDASGHYIFDGLGAGAYVVEVNGGSAPAGYTATGDPDGTLDNRTTDAILLGPGDVYVNADFGYQPADGFAIGDTIFFDANADGTNNVGDYGLGGVTVALISDLNGNQSWDSGEPIIATDLSAGDGTYLFPGLPAGDYLVWVNDTAGILADLVQTADPDGVIDGVGAVTLTVADRLDQDFGFTAVGQTPATGLIGDTIFLDRDGSGTPDNGEGLGGVTVLLVDTNGVVLRNTVTDANGNYFFGGLPDGVYTVRVDTATLPAGVINSVDPDLGVANESSVTIAGGAIDLAQDFGYIATGSFNTVAGTIWEDRNADGTLDAAESNRFANVTLALYGTNGVLVGTTRTDASGNFSFEGLPDGAYDVDVTDDANLLNGYWHADGPNDGSDGNSQSDPYHVAVAGGITNATADFGYYIEGAALGNLTWRDTDGDGIQDAGEPGLTGVVVRLSVAYPGGPTNFVVTTSDANGFYSFGNLLLDEDYNGDGAGPEPIYVISSSTVTGFEWTVMNASGVSDLEDSDSQSGVTALAVKGVTDVATRSSATNETVAASYDFGYRPLSTLVRLVAFRAFVRGGEVVVRWETAMELDTVGFYLERLEWGGGYRRISEELVPAALFSFTGGVYEEIDPGAVTGATYTYRLVEVEGSGFMRYLGPYTVTVDGAELTLDEWSRLVFTEEELGDPGVSAADADPDGDGMSNADEYLAGTLPTEAGSALRLTGIARTGDVTVLWWLSESNRAYTVDVSTGGAGAFEPLAVGVSAEPPVNVFTDRSTPAGRATYRIRLTLP